MSPKPLHYDIKYEWYLLLIILLLLSIASNGYAQCNGDVLIDNESFESGWGIWNDGGNDCDLVSTNANSGTYSIRLRDDSGDNSSMNTNDMNLATYSEIRVAFSYYVVGFNDSSEDFWLQLSTNGGSSFTTVEEWNLGDEFANDERKYDTITISGSFTSNTQLKFVCDASGNNDQVYIDDVVICAVAPNYAPNAVTDDTATVLSPIEIDVLSNDSDPEGDNITLTSIVAAPNHGGTATINNNGTPGILTDDYVDYTPSGLYLGIETFTYQICDDGVPSECSTGTVNVTVTEPNTAPTALSDNATSNTEAIMIDVLGNDSDAQGDNIILSAITVSPDQGATAVINNNGTPGNPADDYIDFTPTGLFFGVESFTYQICDDGSPSLCATATVDVTIVSNTTPTAIVDSGATSISTPIIMDVLANDSDSDGGQTLTLTAITVAPDQGGTAIINNNGTPSDPTDDYIDFTPSGLYIGNETFTYQVCDNGNPNACSTASAVVTISTCFDGSTTENSASFAFGSEWKYEDSGSDLGTSWKETSYADACWSYGNSKLGFGDPVTTTINDHGSITYYFRKHFNVVDAGTINYLKLDLVRDDGAVVYINGNEVLRSNMPNGTLDYLTAAATNVSGTDETDSRSVIITGEHLVDGDNVIAVEVHQDLPSSSDVGFDLALTADIVDHSSDIYIAQGQYWNYSDDGKDLGTDWKTTSFIENNEDWETGSAELGYGDGDESTVIGTGTNYPTYYFRHYFNADGIALTDSLQIRLRKDDGAIVYINGVEVFRHGMGTGTIGYSDWATFTAGGADETKFYDTTILATMITSGINVVAVEVHQVSNTSSDVSFELELSRIEGDPNAYPVTYETISGKIFLDLDASRTYSTGDFGEGTLEVFSYYDRNMNGNIDLDSDPRLFSYLTDINGNYEVNAYHAEVRSIKSDISASNEDAVEDGLNGEVSLTKATQTSIVNDLSATLLVDTSTTWKYFDGGDLADPTWIDESFDDSGWSSGAGDFGFGDPGITTNLTSGNTTYYFRKTFTGGASAGSWNAARINVKRDDGIVIYMNGVELTRNNMPAGTITYSTYASTKVEAADEDTYYEILVTGVSFNTGSNTIAVEIHQDGATSSDTRFDMSLTGEASVIADVGFRFGNIDVPQGAKIVDAFMRLSSASITEDTHNITVEGQNSDNAAVFTTTPYSISSRPRTSANQVWSNDKALLDEHEIKLTNLTDIVQEITDRPGWTSGNAMAFFLNGYDFDIYSYDGGFAPELTISYLDSNQTSAQYLIGVMESDLPATHTFMTDPSPAVTVGSGLRAVTNVNIGYIGATSMCVASSDDAFDALHIINRFSGKNKRIGAFGGAREIEAIAMSKNADTLFAVDGGNFGTIDLATGAFTAYGPSIGTADGAAGSINLNDVDGLSYDLTRNMMWASHRRSGNYDLLFVLDITTGQFIPDVFGAGVDYVVAQGGGLLHDLDDIAINPNTGNLFAMNNDNGGITNLVEIDISTGTPNVINNTGLDDMEGQGFHNDGLFYSTSGREGIPANAFYQVDTSNSFLTLVGFFESEGDFEGCDCKTGHSVNFLDGVVFEDIDEDGIYNEPDILDEGVDVFLYRDIDSNGVYTVGVDTLIGTETTDSIGYFNFVITKVGLFVIVLDTADIPANAIILSAEQSARFGVNGQVQLGNDFGYRNGATLPVELAHFAGENKGQENVLYWTTTAEINNDYFMVERSKDAIIFETIGLVDGAGNSDQKIKYEFVDEQPFKGVNYYRLQQVDFDGSNDYSKIIDLEVKSTDVKGAVSLDVFPNPAHDYIKINGLQELDVNDVVTLNVYDINGVVQLTKLWTISDDMVEFDISEFKNGIYFADLSTSKGLLQTLNFIKQDR